MLSIIFSRIQTSTSRISPDCGLVFLDAKLIVGRKHPVPNHHSIPQPIVTAGVRSTSCLTDVLLIVRCLKVLFVFSAGLQTAPEYRFNDLVLSVLRQQEGICFPQSRRLFRGYRSRSTDTDKDGDLLTTKLYTDKLLV